MNGFGGKKDIRRHPSSFSSFPVDCFMKLVIMELCE